MPKKKILIIDDDREFGEELRELLELEGYNTTAFFDGTSALGMISRIKPDVILLDLKLTGKSGFQIAYELKSFPKTADIPIIAMTGFFTEKEHAELMDICGIQTCLIKPFDSRDVIGKIETVLKKRR
ncbi:MAG: response regulator [Elusimicrobiota bacterium]|nr:response regulator [Elusimicrobiota bacterium]